MSQSPNSNERKRSRSPGERKRKRPNFGLNDSSVEPPRFDSLVWLTVFTLEIKNGSSHSCCLQSTSYHSAFVSLGKPQPMGDITDIEDLFWRGCEKHILGMKRPGFGIEVEITRSAIKLGEPSDLPMFELFPYEDDVFVFRGLLGAYKYEKTTEFMRTLFEKADCQDPRKCFELLWNTIQGIPVGIDFFEGDKKAHDFVRAYHGKIHTAALNIMSEIERVNSQTGWIGRLPLKCRISDRGMKNFVDKGGFVVDTLTKIY